MIRIPFTFDSNYGTYCGTLILEDDHNLTEQEIEDMKLERFTSWVSVIESAADVTPIDDNVSEV